MLYLDDDTVRGWRERFRREGVRALSVFGWKGGASRLAPAQEAELTETLTRRLYPSTAAVMARLDQAYGVAYSKAGVIKLLHRLGFEWRKPKGLPARADVAAQEAFVAGYERLLTGLAPDEMVYFADAVHPEYQSRPAHGWVRKGEHLAVRRGKGRQRVNLAGALCLETGHCQIVEDVRITAETTVELFARLERKKPRQAPDPCHPRQCRHQPRPAAARVARPDCSIRPIYLPSYAPKLNAIERLWKVMHQHVIMGPVRGGRDLARLGRVIVLRRPYRGLALLG